MLFKLARRFFAFLPKWGFARRFFAASPKIALFLAPFLLVPAARAATDFSTLTAAVDVSTVEVGVLALAGTMIGVSVVIWGARKLIAFFQSR